MKAAAKTDAAPKRKRGNQRRQLHSQLDINQIELAYINLRLRDPTRSDVPEFVEIGNSERILRIQKKNLEGLCRRLGRAVGVRYLESELRRLICGEKLLAPFGFAPRHGR